MIKFLPLFAVLSASLAAQSAPLPLKFHSTTRQISLLELYSSEGCSSCPPADAWLSGLKTSAGLWHDFVPVSWHVDYWNNLGWRDPWSNPDFSERQKAYAADWQSDSIYTPCFVLNGCEWRPLARPKGGPSAPAVEIGTPTVNSVDQKHWHVQFTPVSPSAEPYQVHGALLASGLASDVKAGENSGRHLSHDFAVISRADADLPGHTNDFHGDLTLDATPRAISGQPAVAFWITSMNRLAPLQAVGGWLNTPAGQK